MISSKKKRFSNLGRGITTYFHFSQEKIFAPSRWQVLVFLIILFTSLTLSLSNYNSFQLGSYMDDASYAVLAKSMIHSDTYGLINTPGQPASTRYPFGFPLILSVFVLLDPSAIHMLKVASLLATLLNTFLIFWGWPYFSQTGSRWWGLIIAALYAVSPLVIGHSKMVMSEPFFTTLILITLVLVEKFLIKNEIQPIVAMITGAVLALTLFTRSVGLVLIVAVVVRIFIMPLDKAIRQKNFFYLFLGGLVFLVLVTALTPVTMKSLLPNEYLNQLTNPHQWGQSRIEDAFIPRIVSAFSEYVRRHLRSAVIPIGGGISEDNFGKRFGIPNLSLLTSLLIGGVTLLGSLSIFQRQGLAPTVLLFEVLYFIAILFWPWRDARFLYPILPFLFYNFLWGVKIIGRQFSRISFIPGRIRLFAPDLVLAIVVLVLFSFSFYKGISDHSNSLQFVRDLRVGTEWLRENSNRNAVIMAQQPQGIYLYSERNTIDFPNPEDCQSSNQLENLIRKQEVDYILVAPDMAWHQDGSLTYDPYTSEVMLPLLNELEQQHIVKVVYVSDADMVIIYQLLNP